MGNIITALACEYPCDHCQTVAPIDLYAVRKRNTVMHVCEDCREELQPEWADER